MSDRSRRWLACLLLFPSLAVARMGDKPEELRPAGKVASAFHVSRQKVQMPNYTVHELTSGLTTIREYANNQGVVFAITATGQKHADFSALLGSYAGEFKTANATIPRQGRAPVTVKSPNLVVRLQGHGRQLFSRSYVKDLAPAGMSLAEIEALP